MGTLQSYDGSKVEEHRNYLNSKVFQTLKESGGFPVHGCHRGGSGEFGPENTMYNFRRCVWEHQTQLLELDLHLTKDNHLIIMHDSSLNRTTSGQGYIRDYNLEELLQFNAANNYIELKNENITIPTFQEFLDEFILVPNLVFFFLDFKDPDSVEAALKVVEERKIWDRVILGAVPIEANEMLSILKAPETPLISDYQASVEIVKSFMLGQIKSFQFKHDIFGFIITEQTKWVWTKNLVNALHSVGKRVLVCGDECDEPDFQKQCYNWGVDFILTDRPDTLAQTLKEIKEANSLPWCC